jgi:hypothetical protein
LAGSCEGDAQHVFGRWKLGKHDRSDVFHQQGLLPKGITATDVSIWKPGS